MWSIFKMIRFSDSLWTNPIKTHTYERYSNFFKYENVFIAVSLNLLLNIYTYFTALGDSALSFLYSKFLMLVPSVRTITKTTTEKQIRKTDLNSILRISRFAF